MGIPHSEAQFPHLNSVVALPEPKDTASASPGAPNATNRRRRKRRA